MVFCLIICSFSGESDKSCRVTSRISYEMLFLVLEVLGNFSFDSEIVVGLLVGFRVVTCRIVGGL